jgi:hypothetical protein
MFYISEAQASSGLQYKLASSKGFLEEAHTAELTD